MADGTVVFTYDCAKVNETIEKLEKIKSLIAEIKTLAASLEVNIAVAPVTSNL